jgi:nitrate/nitrite-specific signal transduction histidine kinase
MDFNDPATFSYAYKLDGFDKDWTVVTDRNNVTYTNLNPGTYTLLVKNANHLGIWNENSTKLVLIIKPPYWRTWWFIALVIACIAATIYALFRYRLKQKLKLFAVRQRLHRDLHDDVGATLSSVKVYSEILGKNGNDEVISRLIRENATEMMETLEVISWATNPHYDNFKSLEEAMLKFARPVSHADGIQLHFEKSGFDEELMIPGDVRQHLLLIFKEAVNNMLKYSKATACHVKLILKNQQLVLEVKDNGNGSDGTIKGGGAGLRNMHKRAEEINGKLEIELSEGKGTMVRLTLPYPFKMPNSWYRKSIQPK